MKNTILIGILAIALVAFATVSTIQNNQSFKEVWGSIDELKNKIDDIPTSESYPSSIPIFLTGTSNNFNPEHKTTNFRYQGKTMPLEGEITNFTVSLSHNLVFPVKEQAELIGKYTATVFKNKIATNLSCSTSSTDNTCIDSSNIVPVSVLDRIWLQIARDTDVNSGKAIYVQASVVFSQNPNQK